MKGCFRGDFMRGITGLGYEDSDLKISEPAIGLGHKGKTDRLGCEGPRRRASKLGQDATKGELARKLTEEVADEDETRDDETDERTGTNWGSKLVLSRVCSTTYISLGRCMLCVKREKSEVLEIAGRRWKASECATGNIRPECSGRFHA